MTKGFMYSPQMDLLGKPDVIGFGNDEFSVVIIDRDLANEVIRKNHYSGKTYAASYLHLGVFINGEMLGVLQFGHFMNPASGKSIVPGTAIGGAMELNRMWLSDSAPRNSESKSISYGIKIIKQVYPKVKWIQSFADERCGGFGIVYQACSFDYYGEHDAIFCTLDGIVYHNSLMTRNPNLSKSAKILQENKGRATSETLRQFRYIKWIDAREKKKCKLKQQEYPKHYEVPTMA